MEAPFCKSKSEVRDPGISGTQNLRELTRACAANRVMISLYETGCKHLHIADFVGDKAGHGSRDSSVKKRTAQRSLATFDLCASQTSERDTYSVLAVVPISSARPVSSVAIPIRAGDRAIFKQA